MKDRVLIKKMSQRDPLIDFISISKDFCGQLQDMVEKYSEEDSPRFVEYTDKLATINLMDDDVITKVIKPVVKTLTVHSKDILFRNGSMFASSLRMFDDSVDVAMLWRKASPDVRQAMWLFIEQLYVLGYIVCYPEKKGRFLKLVQTLKQQSQDMNRVVDEEMNTSDIASSSSSAGASASASAGTEIGQTVDDISAMLGLPTNDPMTEVISDIAGDLDSMMKQNGGDPTQILTKLMTGDMSMFEGHMEKAKAKLERKIQTGEVSKERLEAQAQSIMGRFSNMGEQMGMNNPMQAMMMLQQMQQMQQPQTGNQQAPSMPDLSGLMSMFMQSNVQRKQ